MSGREGENLPHQPQQVFRLTGEHNGARGVVAIVQGPDTDGIPGGDELLFFSVIEDAGVFRVQHVEHFHAIFPIKGQQHFAVAVAPEGVGILQLLTEFLEAVDFAVAHHGTGAQGKGLHSFRVQTHNGQTVKAQNALTNL